MRNITGFIFFDTDKGALRCYYNSAEHRQKLIQCHPHCNYRIDPFSAETLNSKSAAFYNNRFNEWLQKNRRQQMKIALQQAYQQAS